MKTNISELGQRLTLPHLLVPLLLCLVNKAGGVMERVHTGKESGFLQSEAFCGGLS